MQRPYYPRSDDDDNEMDAEMDLDGGAEDADGLSSLPDEVLVSILGYVPPSSLVEARRVSRGMRNVADEALYRARREARSRICPDEATCQRALACAAVLDDVDDLEAVLVSGVVHGDFRVPGRDIVRMVRLVGPNESDLPGSEDPWRALSRDSTPLALAVKAGSADAVRLLARAGVPPGDAPVRLITAAILSGGDIVQYDACGYTGSMPYPTEAVVDALAAAFPGPPRALDPGWVEQLPFGALDRRAKQLADGRVAIASDRADAVLYGLADALGIQPDNFLSVAAIGAGAPPGADPMAVPVVREGLLRFAAAMDALDVVAVARALIDAGYVPEAEVQRLMGTLRNWLMPLGMMLRGNLSAGWSLLGGAGALPQLTARTLNAAGPALAIFGGEPLGLPGGIVPQLQLPGAATPERVANLLIDTVLWLVYNEPRP
ncbi:F-box domain containing protein [Pandoravirus salinus]|uniref:F-box domain containing protein n=1 Tax=Pandoravirus salinus TaxID=1349410 RepID=S4VZV3_9VIRU|nr:F-box domain [Pandoravirus salinus]AGO83592.1 F-box domain containing protein [Pandoravirus salinus]